MKNADEQSKIKDLKKKLKFGCIWSAEEYLLQFLSEILNIVFNCANGGKSYQCIRLQAVHSFSGYDYKFRD